LVDSTTQEQLVVDNTQYRLADDLCNEINEYLTRLENKYTKRATLANQSTYTLILSAFLPTCLTLISVYTYSITQQFVVSFISLINIALPILIIHNNEKIKHYNKCTDLYLQLTGLKGEINQLAHLNALYPKNYPTVMAKLDALRLSCRDTLEIT